MTVRMHQLPFGESELICGEPLSIAMLSSKVTLYSLHAHMHKLRRFIVLATGEECHRRTRYIGTCHDEENYSFHVFEVL